ncbi:alpha/beta hydrolase family protein [Flavitalea flava]
MKKKWVIIALLFNSTQLFSQGLLNVKNKPAINFSAIKNWPKLANSIRISPNGEYILYTIINQPIGGSTVIAQAVNNSWTKEFVGVESDEFSDDSQWAILKEGDSLGLLSLGNNDIAWLTKIGQYVSIMKNNRSCVAYMRNNGDRDLVIRELGSGKNESFHDVIDFQLDDQKKYLTWRSCKKNDIGFLYDFHFMNLVNDQKKIICQNAAIPFNNMGFNQRGNSLLYSCISQTDKDTLYFLHLYESGTNLDQIIWENKRAPGNCTWDKSGQQITFYTRDTIWYFKKGMVKMKPLITNSTAGISEGFKINPDGPVTFNQTGKIIMFYIVEREKVLPLPSPNSIKVDVWHYRDKELQSVQLGSDGVSFKSFAAAANIVDSKVIRIEQEGERSSSPLWNAKNHLILLPESNSATIENFWQKGKKDTSSFLFSLKDGSRTPLKIEIGYFDPVLELSPKDDYVLYYDPFEDGYCSYQISQGITRHLTKKLGLSWRRTQFYQYFNTPNPFFEKDPRPRGIAGWTEGDTSLLVYDSYDLWKIDPSGVKNPVNITHGYGRKNHVVLEINSICRFEDRDVFNETSLIFNAFNEDTKHSGYFRIPSDFDRNQSSEPLSMGPYSNIDLLKATNSDTWILTRGSFNNAPNLYATNDFKRFTRLSNIQPHKEFNWYTTELVNWKLSNGENCQGLLFKPENLDSSKKYPLLFNYYQSSSDGAFTYFEPKFAYASNINIPYFVSKEYLVFMPDIHFRMGHPGESVLNSLISVVQELSKRSYVDLKRMGLAGHSWGGYETNYLVTHSHLFEAASEGAGPSDFISDYNGINGLNGIGPCHQSLYEVGQSRIGGTLWQKPDLFIENSPIFNADQVTTPLLIVHNKNDKSVPWSQGVEMFTALRRLGKRVWMLQYDNEEHNLTQAGNIIDYTIRLTQFFDHYLKNLPAPKWMTEGIPASQKGIVDGLELDLSRNEP